MASLKIGGIAVTIAEACIHRSLANALAHTRHLAMAALELTAHHRRAATIAEACTHRPLASALIHPRHVAMAVLELTAVHRRWAETIAEACIHRSLANALTHARHVAMAALELAAGYHQRAATIAEACVHRSLANVLSHARHLAMAALELTAAYRRCLASALARAPHVAHARRLAVGAKELACPTRTRGNLPLPVIKDARLEQISGADQWSGGHRLTLVSRPLNLEETSIDGNMVMRNRTDVDPSHGKPLGKLPSIGLYGRLLRTEHIDPAAGTDIDLLLARECTSFRRTTDTSEGISASRRELAEYIVASA